LTFVLLYFVLSLSTEKTAVVAELLSIRQFGRCDCIYRTTARWQLYWRRQVAACYMV